jgi:capsular exopolysaccharide synthesis family protein
MELKQLLTVFKRWSWLLALGLIVGAVSGYMLSRILIPTYEGRTKILVARTQQQKNSDMLYSNEQQYVDTYMELLKTDPVLDTASSKLGFKIDDTRILVQQVRTTQLVEVIVEDPDPERAAAIANTLVTAFLEQKSFLDSSRYDATEQVLQSQIQEVELQMASLQTKLEEMQIADVQDQVNQVDVQIASLQEKITKLQTEVGNLSAATTRVQQSELVQKQNQLSQIQSILYLYEQIRANLLIVGKSAGSGNGSQGPQALQLQATLDLYQQIYLSLLNNLESLRLTNFQNAPTISQLEKAVPQKAPIRPLTSIYTMLAGMIGLILTSGTAFLIEYLDDTIKSAEELERILDVPVVGSIVETYRINEPGDIYSVSNPNTFTAEAFRQLRISFNFAKSGKPLKTIAVLSPNAGDGKTTMAVNLAALFAQGGKHVTLVDANLRQPAIHKVLSLENQTGFSELLDGMTDVQGVNYSLGDGQGFDIIPGGSLPVNLAELLEAENIEHAITKIKKNSNIVIFDGPPLVFAEAQLLAAKVDAVLLIMRPGTMSVEAARTLLTQLNRVGAHIVGVALNRVSSRKISFSHYQNSRVLETTKKRLIPLVKKMWNRKVMVDVQN